MPIIDINLLKQQQHRSLRLLQANVVVAIVAGAIIGLELLIVIFLYSTVAVRTGQKNGVTKETEELTAKVADLDKTQDVIYPGLTLTQQATAYQSQVDAAKGIVDNHKYFTLYLSEIAINTPSTVVYSSFSSDAQGRLVVTGTADSYGDVSKLVESFGRLSFAKSAQLQDAKLDSSRVGKGQAVRFTMSIELKSAAELKKKPAPRPSASPSLGSGPQSPKPQSSPGASSGQTLPTQGAGP